MKAIRLCVAAIAVVSAFMCLPSAAVAQELTKQIAVVNLEGVMRASKASQTVHDQVEALRKKYQAEFEKKDKELRDQDKALADQRNIMAPDAFEQEKRSFQTKVAEVQRDMQMKRVQLDRALAKAIKEIEVAVSDVISDFAKEKGFSIILPSGALLFADASYNASEEILSRLDKKISKVDVKLEPVPVKEN